MGKLVFIQDGKAVTDSLLVADVFNKEHRRVLQDIRELGCSEKFRQHNFVQSSYLNSQNKEMPMYYMSEKGFTMLVMGYTGPKAMEFKEKYIEEFERMEAELKGAPRVLSDREKLMASMKLSLETAEEMSAIKDKVLQLEQKVDNQVTLDLYQQQALQQAVKNRVYKLFPDFEGVMSREKLFAQIYSHIKRAFAAPSYRMVRRKDYDDAMQWVSSWRPLV